MQSYPCTYAKRKPFFPKSKFSDQTTESKGPTPNTDVFGFGLLLIELLTGKSRADPELENMVEWARYCYSDCHLEMWVDPMIKNNDRQALIDHQNQIVETMNLALHCTAGDPNARPSAVDLVKNLESIVRSSSCVSSRFFKLFNAS